MPVDPQSRVGRAVQWATKYPWFTRVVGPRVIPSIDRVLHRLSGGRVQLAQMVLNSLELTTTGRKSGLERTVTVAYFLIDGATFVVGSNFGREHAPAWALNLLADQRARIRRTGGDWEDVRAHVLTEDEREEAWPHIVSQWSTFATYRETVGERTIHLFRLDPAGQPTA